MEEKIYFKDSKNYFTYYSISEVTLPLVVVIPGGGYHHTSLREAKNVVDFFLPLGFHAVVLNYREQHDVYPVPQKELAYIMDFFRENADRYHVDSNKILNIGFSAGAHLMLSQTIYHNEYGKNSLPNGLVICYPVVSSNKEFGHLSSFDVLINGLTIKDHAPSKEETYKHLEALKDNGKYDLLDKLSIERHIPNDFPESFMWHTQTDESVNIRNSLVLYNAFVDKNINCEYHIFPRGSHGMSLADDSMTVGGKYLKDDYIHQWTTYLVNWLRLKNWIK